MSTRDDWDQLSILDQWLLLLAADLRRGRDRAEMASCDFDRAGEGLKEFFQRSSIGRVTIPRDASLVSFFHSHYKQIFRKTPLSLWGEMLAVLRRDRLPLTVREAQALERLSSLWKQLESSDRQIRLNSVTTFVEAFVAVFGWEVVKRESIGNETIYWLKAPNLKLKLGPIVLLIVTFVFSEAGSGESALRWTYDLLSRTTGKGSGAGKVGINLIVGQGPELSKYEGGFLKSDDFLCFSEVLLREIFTAERPIAKIEEFIKNSLSLSRLNPYHAVKPVDRADMFFGREKEIRAVLDNPGRDYAVFGARQIGKTSLLLYLRDVIGHSINRRPIFLDCSTMQTPDKLAYEIALQINPRRASRIRMSQVSQMVRAAFSLKREPFILLLDEADQLISFARHNSDWTFLQVIRSLANDGFCQTVMAGYKVLFEAWQDRSTPLFNFVHPLYLSVLSQDSARQLVIAPTKELGVEFAEPTLIDQMINESGCHPSFLQFFCSELIDVLAKRNARTAAAADFHSVRNKREYRDFVMKPFRSEVDFSPLERWLVLALANEKLVEFNAREIVETLGHNDRWLTSIAVDRALLNLELGGLIRVKQNPAEALPGGRGLQYTWTIPAFVRILERTINVERQIRELRAKVVAS